MSKAIRKYRFKTDGTFNMISVALTEYGVKNTGIVPSEVLKVFLPFDRERYNLLKGTDDCEYYLELLEAGYRKAAEFKEIPLDILLKLIEDFRANGCKNQGLIKKRKFKNNDLQISLTYYLTTNDYHVDILITQLSTKKELINDTIYTTNADESSYSGNVTDIIIEENQIILIDEFKDPTIIINLQDVFNSKLNYKQINYLE